MNRYLLAAAIMSFLTMLVHVFLGGPEVLDPGLASPLDDVWKGVFVVVWHAVSAILLINAVALGFAARGQGAKPVALLVAAQYLAFTALFLFYGATMLGTLWPMPQWIIFIAISAVILWPYRPGQQAARG